MRTEDLNELAMYLYILSFQVRETVYVTASDVARHLNISSEEVERLVDKGVQEKALNKLKLGGLLVQNSSRRRVLQLLNSYWD